MSVSPSPSKSARALDGATVHARSAGVTSTFPAASFARTSNACDPTASPEYDRGETQTAHTDPSSRHSNVEPASGEENSNTAEAALTVPLGPLVITVSGGVVSDAIVHVYVAG